MQQMGGKLKEKLTLTLILLVSVTTVIGNYSYKDITTVSALLGCGKHFEISNDKFYI